MTTLSDVITYMLTEADDAGIDRVVGALKERRKTLRSVAAASVQVGATVELKNLSPKYLNGLTGTVLNINGQRGDVTLDAESTSTLRWSGTRYHIPSEQEHYLLRGVPLSSCKVTS